MDKPRGECMIAGAVKVSPDKPMKVCWIAGPPRMGSMWIYNVVRELLAEANCDLAPADLTIGRSAIFAAMANALDDPEPQPVSVLKFHGSRWPTSDRARIVTSRRDPRDALMSYMRFMARDFTYTLMAADAWTRWMDRFRRLPPDRCLVVEYGAIGADPESTIETIATFIGVSPAAGSAARIASALDKAKVRTLIESRDEEGLPDTASATRRIGPAVGFSRRMDIRTGFQSGHVSDYRDGDWRRILDDSQKREVDRVLGAWLSRNGFGS